MEEIWKDIEDYEGLYEVSSMGRIRSLDKFDSIGRYVKGKILQSILVKNGYMHITLCKGGEKHSFSIHRLVAEAFIPNPDNKPCIDHINTDRTDNRAENLRWVTYQENNNNPLTKNKKCGENHPKPFKGIFGKEHPRSLPILQFTKEGGLIKIWDNTRSVEKETNISHSNICNVLKGKRDYAGGYKWKYYDKETYLIGIMNNNIKKGAA